MSEQLALIELPINELLNKFGSGTHAPGSGSAAALMGMLSSKLIATVSMLTLSKPAYRPNYAQINFILDKVTIELEPLLRDLFQRDATIFDEVIKARIVRDNAVDERERRRCSEHALETLKLATEVPFQICEACITLIDYGGVIFDLGFKSARGDTGAAISASVAGAMAAIFVINLNLKSFRGSEWAIQQRKRCDDLHKTLERKQLEAFGRVTTLRGEDLSSMNLKFGIDLETAL